jgi:hypothetical protein
MTIRVIVCLNSEIARRHTVMKKAEQHTGNTPQVRSERREYWTSQVLRWKRSGLTQKEYCIKGGISVERFGYWKRSLDSESQNGARSLVAVPTKTVSSALFTARPALGLVVDERYRVEIPDTFSPSTLEAVLQVLSHL